MAGKRRRRAPREQAEGPSYGPCGCAEANPTDKIEHAPSHAWYDSSDVLHRIFFNFLSLSDVLQCRLVCKSWHLSLRSIDQIRHRLCCFSHHPISGPVCLRPEIDDMHVCPRLTTTGSCACWKTTLHINIHRQTYKRCVVAASAHGLLCLQLDNGQYVNTLAPSLVVCNPMTGTHKLLPGLTCIHGIESVGMHYNLLRKSYTLFVIGTTRNSPRAYFHGNGDPVKKPFYVLHVEIYSSEVGTWEYQPHFITDTGVKKGKIVWWQGRYHWVVQKSGFSITVLAYDTTYKQWVDSDIPSMGGYGLPNIFVWGDSLMCLTRYNFNYQFMQLLRSSSSSLQSSGIDSSIDSDSTNDFATHFSSSDKMYWCSLDSRSEEIREKSSLHIGTHYSLDDFYALDVCIFNPYSCAPAEGRVTSRQDYIINVKRQAQGSCFSYIPCVSVEA